MFSRKKHSKNSDLPAVEPTNTHSSTRSFRSIFGLSKTSTRTTFGSSSVDDSLDNSKGPLGLTLLYSPPNPQIDFIFVHGLGGGSRKTWSKTSQRSHYWPQEWLSKDPAFKNVRIHSYGYNSDYLKGKENCLNIHHFGKSLLGEISTSPCISESGTKIVAIGHSMGGLVIKKAYLLAHQDLAYNNLASRFSAVFFLATPHRGADSATMLKNLLKIAYDRAYVADLQRDSGAVQVINDEFRHVSTGLELWSFYETQNMKMFGSTIVNPDSAILGYPKEKQIPMVADHRSICKFDTERDPNYVILRNALASTVSNMASTIPEPKLKAERNMSKDIKTYLQLPGFLDEDLLSACDARMPQTCQWISTKDSYIRWRDGQTREDRTLLIKGKPATGKSVLAGFVTHQLQESGHSCSYFFFKHGDREKSHLGHCLRSLAFQMAISNTQAGNVILELQADGVRLDQMNERTLWRILFLSGIFPATKTRHYWVIDGLDECSDSSVLFDAFLPNIDDSVPLRILITSRETASLNQGVSSMPSSFPQTLSISIADTQSDLRLLVEKKAEDLRVVGPKDQEDLVEKILDKSRGSFLWTILVVKELLRCHSKKEIDKVLNEVPSGMKSLYRRTLTAMSKATRGKQLAKAILVWATCAVRPMTINELNGALSLDIEDTISDLEQSIDTLCGQLVVVNKFGRVQMVHETAREFLLSVGLDSEFAIKTTAAHTRMAQVCLMYLNQKEMKPPRTNWRRFSENHPTAARSGFADYACAAYSFHLSEADPLATRPFELVEQFLNSNVLTWIEAIAQSRDLNQLIRASEHLKAYFNACAVERSPQDLGMINLQQWIVDLSRIPAKFANALTTSPSAIYSLIPPFCPTGSMIHRSGGAGRRLTVLGALNDHWDDRLMCIDFRQGQTSALCYGEEFLAIGLAPGSVALYYATSYQQYMVLGHGEIVKFIAFKNKSNLMATCGMKMVKMWDIRSGEMVHSFDSPPRPLAMGFLGDTLLVASQKNYIASWDVGKDAATGPTHKPWSDGSGASSMPPRGPPCALALSPSKGMLAVAYSGKPITLWDMEEDAFAGNCGKKLPSGKTSGHVVVALVFNPNPNIGLLAAAYLDGDLALLDPFADQQLKCFRANCQTLAASPNGRLLAAGGADGMIHVYEFETFKLLYRVKSSNSYIKQLRFSRDSLRLADIRSAQCTVWEPEVLLRGSLSNDRAEDNHVSTSVVETVVLGAKDKVTAMVSHPTSDVVFCGRDDGTVVLYNRETAEPVKTLYSHKSPVHILVWCEQRNALLSVDASNRIFLHEVQISAGQGLSPEVVVLFQSHLKSEKAIVNVLMGEKMGKFMVSTRESDHLFSLESGEHEMEWASNMQGMRKWLPAPESPHHLICVSSVEARIYSWADFSEVKSFSLSLDTETVQLKNAALYSFGQKQTLLLELLDRDGWTDRTRIATIDTDSFVLSRQSNRAVVGKNTHVAGASASTTNSRGKDVVKSSELVLSYPLQSLSLSSSIAHVIGFNDFGKFVFIDRSSWVCSTDLHEGGLNPGKNASGIEIFRHFFVPYEWFAGGKAIVCALVANDILLTRGGALAVIRGAFDHAERVEF